MTWTTPRTWVSGELVTAAIMNTHLRDNLTYTYNSRSPTGAMMPYAGASAPPHWLLCDGAALSRSTYSTLYATIGDDWKASGELSTRTDDDTGVVTVVGGNRGLTTSETLDLSWSGGSRSAMSITGVSGADITLDGGSGDNLPALNTVVYLSCASNKFFVPDLRDRTPVGKADMGGTDAARVGNADTTHLGDVGGEDEHTLTTAEMPSHSHQFTAYRNVSPTFFAAGSDYWGPESTGATASTGSDDAHNNMPPFLTLNWIIKT